MGSEYVSETKFSELLPQMKNYPMNVKRMNAHRDKARPTTQAKARQKNVQFLTKNYRQGIADRPKTSEAGNHTQPRRQIKISLTKDPVPQSVSS